MLTVATSVAWSTALGLPFSMIPSRSPPVAVAVAGMLFGASYLIREFSPFLLPAVLAAVFLLRYSWRRIGLLAGAAVATAARAKSYHDATPSFEKW